MRIFLGLTLLAVALEARIHPSEYRDGTEIDMLDATEIIVHAFQYEHGPHRDDIVDDYFGRGIHLESGKMSRELFGELKAWGKRWNLELIEGLDYDNATEGIIIPTATPSTESTNGANDERVRYLIRAIFKAFGIENEAIDDFFARKLHVPLTMDRYPELVAWGNGWGVKNLDKATDSLYREELGLEKERHWKVEASDPGTPPAFQAELKIKLIRAQVVRDMVRIFDHLREFAFEHNKPSKTSFHNLTDYEQQVIGKVYLDVNENVTMQFGPYQEDKIKQWNIRELRDLFTNTYEYTQYLGGAIVNGEINDEMGAPERAKESYKELTQYEKKLVNRVYFDLERKVAKQLGYAKDEGGNITY